MFSVGHHSQNDPYSPPLHCFQTQVLALHLLIPALRALVELLRRLRIRAGEEGGEGGVRETLGQSGSSHQLSPSAGAAAGPARLHGARGWVHQEGVGVRRREAS